MRDYAGEGEVRDYAGEGGEVRGERLRRRRRGER